MNGIIGPDSKDLPFVLRDILSTEKPFGWQSWDKGLGNPAKGKRNPCKNNETCHNAHHFTW
jgi:hypothetical protein